MNKPTIIVVAALIFDSDNQVLITQRAEGQDLAGYWEFPGGRIEEGETPQKALRREIEEELALEISVGELYLRESFEYETKIVDIAFYTCKQLNPTQKPQCIEVADWKRIRLTKLTDYKFPPADKTLIQQLLEVDYRY